MNKNNDEMIELLQRQKQAHLANMNVSAEQRKARLQQVIDVVVDNYQILVEAMEIDFGGRHPGFSIMNDILGSLASLKYTRDNLQMWLSPEQRTVFSPYDQLGAKAHIQYQPKGVVGIIGTWNAPLFTLLSPLACALGAGNRAILKPSEVTATTADVLKEIFDKHLDPEVVSVVVGGVEISRHFTRLDFDHLVFTGSTSVGKKVMQGASEHLVPVTLELGGKSPAILGKNSDLLESCRRIAIAKGNNGGQLCISPDILYVPTSQVQEASEQILEIFKTQFPEITDNPDVVPVVNDYHCARIVELVQDARDKGTEVKVSHHIDNIADVAKTDRRLPLHIIIAPTIECKIMQEEIFGPAIIVLPYETIDEVILDINKRDKPLALYYFGEDKEEMAKVLANTSSGGVSVNDCLMHAAMHDAPFGGIGASGMGHYHGKEGFLTFSHMRTVFHAPKHDPRAEWGMLAPYHDQFKEAMAAQVTKD